jgi:hypothetical protein
MDDSDEVTIRTACTLDAEDARQQVTRWRMLSSHTQPTVTHPGPDTIEVHYCWSPHVIAELTSLAAAESECCAFLTFAVHAAEHRAGHEAILTIEPSPGAAADVAQSLSTWTSLITGADR